jgi:hypothetical protein
MHVRPTEEGQVELSVSLDQLKRVYTALFCRLQTGGCTSFDDLEKDDMLLTIQGFLQREAAAQGVDCTVHEDWEAFLGITHPPSCPRRGSGGEST